MLCCSPRYWIESSRQLEAFHFTSLPHLINGSTASSRCPNTPNIPPYRSWYTRFPAAVNSAFTTTVLLMLWFPTSCGCSRIPSSAAVAPRYYPFALPIRHYLVILYPTCCVTLAYYIQRHNTWLLRSDKSNAQLVLSTKRLVIILVFPTPRCWALPSINCSMIS